MPKITDLTIQKNNKARANLYLDGEFAFGVEMLTVMKLGLKIGQEVSEEKLKEAIFDSEKSVAFEKAVDYLARGMKTEKQMRDYLQKKGYPLEIVNVVVDKLKDYRYVDDKHFAQLYVEQNVKSKGQRRLKQELQQKGISSAWAEEAAQTDDETERENALALAQKYMRGKTCDLKNLQRLQRYLLSRGYGFDTVNGIVRTFKTFDGGDVDD
ncbi:MAG: RecX family transcriptional regulator [Candidatus Fimimonas sp.]